MKRALVHILLLSALFFNITHATIIAIKDSCHHESVHEYILEQSQATECGDLCDMHHLFHFMAILKHETIEISEHQAVTKLTHTNRHYNASFQEANIKPPIA